MARNLDKTPRYITIAAIVALVLAAASLYACNYGGEGTGAPEINPESLAPPDLQLAD